MLKNIGIGLAIFLTSFLIGYFAVLPFLRPLPVIEPVDVKGTTAAIAGQESAPEDLTSIVAEYNPVNTDSSRPRIRSKVKLLWSGDFHSEDFPYKTGGVWLGLFKDGGDYFLKPTKISVSKISDPELFDLTVKTERKGEPVFLVQGAPYIHESQIPTVYENIDEVSEDSELKGEVRTFDFNKVIYQLRVENIGADDYPSKGSKLILMADGKQQTLRYLKNGCNDCSWTLDWAGDLDLDGKLDFFMNLTDHYNVVDQVLFLSSPAEKGKLVKFVASFFSIGC